jgi:hypothetical protein
MAEGIAQWPVQGEVPTDVVVHPLHRLPIRQSVQKLQKAHAISRSETGAPAAERRLAAGFGRTPEGTGSLTVVV